jgi:sulfate adenylyltransferase subunit 1
MEENILRIVTSGNVDDGKSTLLGRLLYDSKSILEEQLESLKKISEKKGEREINLAFLVDGLKSEREQGITIDVAYRYFSTPKRNFILIDSPGHTQYTKNMITGASNADVGIIIIDASRGIKDQTKRHFFILSLLGIREIIICINKMDLVDFDENKFNSLRSEILEISRKYETKSNLTFIPISALNGDNIIKKSTYTQWYHEKTLLEILEQINIENKEKDQLRFPIQGTIRLNEDKFKDYRAYTGRIENGSIKKGDKIKILPSGIKTNVKEIITFKTTKKEAISGESISISLEDKIDIIRGDMIVKEQDNPIISKKFNSIICWMGDKALDLETEYIIKQTTKETPSKIKNILYKLDISNLKKDYNDKEINQNDIFSGFIETSSEIVYDKFSECKKTGCFIIIDRTTNETIGAGIITD